MSRPTANDKTFSGSRSFAGLALAILFATCGLASFAQSQPPAQQPAQPSDQQSGQQPDQQSGPMPPRPAQGVPADDPSQESSSKRDPVPDSSADAKAAKKDPVPDSATDQPKSKGAKPGVLPPEDDPAWDPFHAQQDVDVGEFCQTAIAAGRDVREERRQRGSPALLQRILAGAARRAGREKSKRENRKAIGVKEIAK